MLHPGALKVGDFVRPVAGGGNKDEGVAKVIVVSGNEDLVVENPNGVLTVCKANEWRTADDQAAQVSHLG